MTHPTDSLQARTSDERDFALGAVINWPRLSELPDEYEVKPLSIKDQNADGNLDFCASCAGAGMIEPKEEVELFYPFLFAAAKHEAKKDPDSFGLELRDVGKALQKWGVPELRDVPEEVKNLPPAARRRWENYLKYPDLLQSAAKHRAQSYFFLDGYPKKWDAYDALRAATWYFRHEKQHAMIGVVWGWDLADFQLRGKPKGYGHALWCNGWFEDGLRIVNSAGKGAGKDGIHLLSRATFNHYAKTYGMMMVVDLPRDSAEYILQNKIKLDDNWAVQILKSLLVALKLGRLIG